MKGRGKVVRRRLTSVDVPALCLLPALEALSSLCFFSSASFAFFARISSRRFCILAEGF